MTTEAATASRRRLVQVYALYLLAALVFFGPVLFMLWSAFRRNVDITGSIFDVATPLTTSTGDAAGPCGQPVAGCGSGSGGPSPPSRCS